MPVITIMYAKPSPSQSCSDVSGAGEKSPNQSPTSSSTERTPSGAAMKRMPTTKKLAASRRQLRTTKRSALAPVMRRGAYVLPI